MPSRFVPYEEAKARAWTFYYIGETCKYGHMAPRYVSNKHLCVDCHRIRDGRLPIGAKAEKQTTEVPKAYKGPKPNELAAAVVRPIEPDNTEKRFLVEYAKHRDFAKASEACGRHESEFLGRLSYSRVFREAVNQLEADNGLTRTPSLNEDFEWTDDKRVTLIRMYINTGDLSKSMAAVGVTNFHYEMELQDNAEFRSAMDKAEEIAMRHIERIGIGRAIDGDSRLLQKVMAAKNPDYGDRVKVDMNVTQKLTDDQLNTRLIQIFEQCGGVVQASPPVVDAEFTNAPEEREVETAGTTGGALPPPATQSNLDLV